MFAVVSDTDKRAMERLIREAIRRAFDSMDQAAREAEMSAPQFTRQVQLQEGTLRRFAMLGPKFWQWWVVGLAAHYGLPKEVTQAYRLHRRTKAFKRMARMTLRAQGRERMSA